MAAMDADLLDHVALAGVQGLSGGMGPLAGAYDNPLGARALYLYQGNHDTLFPLHGTNEPEEIGQAVS